SPYKGSAMPARARRVIESTEGGLLDMAVGPDRRQNLPVVHGPGARTVAGPEQMSANFIKSHGSVRHGGSAWRRRIVAQPAAEAVEVIERRRKMVQYLRTLGQQVNNEKGAEIVEWVLWVGGIAILAGALYVVVSVALTNTVNTVVGGITSISSS